MDTQGFRIIRRLFEKQIPSLSSKESDSVDLKEPNNVFPPQGKFQKSPFYKMLREQILTISWSEESSALIFKNILKTIN